MSPPGHFSAEWGKSLKRRPLPHTPIPLYTLYRTGTKYRAGQITELAEAGTSDAALMAVAGHVSREMMEHYSHVRMTAKREALDKISSGLMSALPDADEAKSGAPN